MAGLSCSARLDSQGPAFASPYTQASSLLTANQLLKIVLTCSQSLMSFFPGTSPVTMESFMAPTAL